MWNCTHCRHPTDEQLRRLDISSNNNLPSVPDSSPVVSLSVSPWWRKGWWEEGKRGRESLPPFSFPSPPAPVARVTRRRLGTSQPLSSLNWYLVISSFAWVSGVFSGKGNERSKKKKKRRGRGGGQQKVLSSLSPNPLQIWNLLGYLFIHPGVQGSGRKGHHGYVDQTEGIPCGIYWRKQCTVQGRLNKDDCQSETFFERY